MQSFYPKDSIAKRIAQKLPGDSRDIESSPYHDYPGNLGEDGPPLDSDEPKKWYCPNCQKPTVIEASLGWRDCSSCGWKEQLPGDLREVQPHASDEAIELRARLRSKYPAS